MSFNKLLSFIARLFFAGACILLCLAIIERVANIFGYTFEPIYLSGRLLEFAVVLLVFVISIQLKELKELYSGKKL